jgi:hypothetical protein
MPGRDPATLDGRAMRRGAMSRARGSCHGCRTRRRPAPVRLLVKSSRTMHSHGAKRSDRKVGDLQSCHGCWLLPWRESWDPGSQVVTTRQQKVGTAIRFRPDSIGFLQLNGNTPALSRHKSHPHSTDHVTRRLSQLPIKLHSNNAAPPWSKHRYIRAHARAPHSQAAARKALPRSRSKAQRHARAAGPPALFNPPTRDG